MSSSAGNEGGSCSRTLEEDEDIKDRRPLKMSKTENTSFLDTYDSLVLEEEEAVEVGANRFWALPVTDAEGISDVTSLFLSIVEEPSILGLLWDGSSIKKRVWEKVAYEMTRRGVPILTAKNETDAGAKCNQKWKNLCRMHASYQKYLIDNRKSKIFRPKPKYYDDLDRILSHRPPEYNQKRTIELTSASAESVIENLLNPLFTSNVSPSHSPVYQSHQQSDSDSSLDSLENSRHYSRSLKRFSILDVIEILKQVRREDRRERRTDKITREEDRKLRQTQFSQLMAKLDQGNELLGKMANSLEQFIQQKT